MVKIALIAFFAAPGFAMLGNHLVRQDEAKRCPAGACSPMGVLFWESLKHHTTDNGSPQEVRDGTPKGPLTRESLAKIHGRIQIVESLPDYRVKVVTALPDLKVQIVDTLPHRPGQWQLVESLPDYRIQIVDALPDFTIQYVETLPGLP